MMGCRASSGGGSCRERAFSASRRSARPQSGFSFIEVLVVLMLSATVITAIAGGMLTLMKVNRGTAEIETIELALGSYTERLLVSPYLPCGATPADQPTAGDYNAIPGVWTPPRADMTATVISVEFWDHDAAQFVDSCPADGDDGTQRLNVEVSYRDRTGSAQIVTTNPVEGTP